MAGFEAHSQHAGSWRLRGKDEPDAGQIIGKRGCALVRQSSVDGGWEALAVDLCGARR